MKATIAAVSYNPKPYTNNFGKQVYYINGAFANNTVFKLATASEEKAKEIEATLKNLIGKEEEYDLTDDGKVDRDGRKQLYMKSWPGKPAAQGFGGRAGKEYIPRYRDTEQGTKEERLSICRSVALQEARAWLPHITNASAFQIPGQPTVEMVLETAEKFYQWLIKELPPIQRQVPEAVSSSPTASSLPAPAPARTYQKPPCPQCGNAESVFQEKDRNSGQYVPGSFYCWRQKGGCGHQWKDVGELAHALGVQRGDQIKPVLEVVKEEIEKAKQTKSLTHLKAVEERVCQRVDEGKISLDQADEIEKLISAARKVLQSGQNQAAFHDQKVQEAQREMQRQQQLEMHCPLEETETPF